jgi:hypothetical protein
MSKSRKNRDMLDTVMGEIINKVVFVFILFMFIFLAKALYEIPRPPTIHQNVKPPNLEGGFLI